MKFTVRDLDILARTIYGEARGEPRKGKVAVAHVVLNRRQAGRRHYGRGIAGICIMPWQFSCWNPRDPNSKRLPKLTTRSAPFRACLEAAAAVLSGNESDLTRGATHYMTRARRRQGWPGSWGRPKEPCARIGAHLFYNNID